MTRTENERLAVVENEVRHQTIRHEEFRDEVRSEFRSVRGDVASVKDDVAEIRRVLTKAEGGWLAILGGWRTLIAVGGFVSGLVAAAHWLWSWVLPFLPR